MIERASRSRVRALLAWVVIWLAGLCLFLALPSWRGYGDIWAFVFIGAYALFALAPVGLFLAGSGGRFVVIGWPVLAVAICLAVSSVLVLTGSMAYFDAAAAYAHRDASAQVGSSKSYLDAARAAGMGPAKKDAWPRLTSRGVLLDRRSEVDYMLGRFAADSGDATLAAKWYSLAGRIAQTQNDREMQALIEHEVSRASGSK